MAELDSPALRAVPNLETPPRAMLFSEGDERATIGAVIQALPATRQDILHAYLSDDLADPRCCFVDSIIRQMVADGLPIDQVLVVQYAVSRALIKPDSPRMQLASWVAETCDFAPVPASGTWYAAAVVEQSVRRALVAIADGLAAAAEGCSVLDLPTIVSDAFRAALAAVSRLGDGR